MAVEAIKLLKTEPIPVKTHYRIKTNARRPEHSSTRLAVVRARNPPETKS
jgi:hypothetical protein